MKYLNIAAIAVLASVAAAPALAHGYAKGALSIDHPWARETAPGQTVGGAFMTINNKGKQDDRLVSANSAVAGEVQIHTVSMTGGIMKMRQLTNGLPIPAGKSVTLKPGGYHVMLIGLKRPLQRGASIPLTLHFSRAGDVKVELAVQAVTSSAPMDMRHD